MYELFLPVTHFSLTELLGWLGISLLGATIAIPYVRRAPPVNPGADIAAPERQYRRVLWPHYWLGPALVAVSFIHAWIPMAAGPRPPGGMSGLWLATYALGLLMLQVFVGLILRYLEAGPARVVRRVHFTLMLGIVVLLLSHLWVNGALAHASGWHAGH